MRRWLLGCGLLLALALAPVARAVDLEGTWYVLIHFQDAETNKPDAWRWDDRVWKFEQQGRSPRVDRVPDRAVRRRQRVASRRCAAVAPRA